MTTVRYIALYIYLTNVHSALAVAISILNILFYLSWAANWEINVIKFMRVYISQNRIQLLEEAKRLTKSISNRKHFWRNCLILRLRLVLIKLCLVLSQSNYIFSRWKFSYMNFLRNSTHLHAYLLTTFHSIVDFPSKIYWKWKNDLNSINFFSLFVIAFD